MMNSTHPITTPRATGVNPTPGLTADQDFVPSFLPADEYQGCERRVNRRIPRSLEISVQPLSDQMVEFGKPFFAITRDISQGGLAYLSSRQANFEKAIISLNDGIAPGIVCRICNSSVIHCSGMEEVCLTNVEFMYVHKRRK